MTWTFCPLQPHTMSTLHVLSQTLHILRQISPIPHWNFHNKLQHMVYLKTRNYKYSEHFVVFWCTENILYFENNLTRLYKDLCRIMWDNKVIPFFFFTRALKYLNIFLIYQLKGATLSCECTNFISWRDQAYSLFFIFGVFWMKFKAAGYRELPFTVSLNPSLYKDIYQQ